MVRPLLGGQESSIIKLPGFGRGARFTMNALWPEVSRLNLIELVPALQMPVFFLLAARIAGVRRRPAWPISTR